MRIELIFFVHQLSSEMPAQANILVDRMINRLGQAEFDSSWKLVTLFIGGNDACDVCNDDVDSQTTSFSQNFNFHFDIDSIQS